MKAPTLKYCSARGDMIEILRFYMVIMIILVIIKFLCHLILVLLRGITYVNWIKVLSNMKSGGTFFTDKSCGIMEQFDGAVESNKAICKGCLVKIRTSRQATLYD